MSILRYPGGKSKAIKTIETFLPDTEYTTVISPFFGGGSFELHMRDKQKIIIANDKFEPLYNFWIHASSSNRLLVDSIKALMPVSKENFHTYRKALFLQNDNLVRAAYYYIINRCSFSGTTCSGGFSEQASTKRLNDNSVQRLSDFSSDNIQFSNLDYKDFLQDKVSMDKCLVFADPPYYLGENSKLYGNKGDLHEQFDHLGLFNILKQFPMFMLCYNDCDYIRELYKDYHIHTVNWKYGMNKSKKSSEILILSYSINQ